MHDAGGDWGVAYEWDPRAFTPCLPGLALQVMGKLIESEEDKFWLKEGGHLDYSR